MGMILLYTRSHILSTSGGLYLEPNYKPPEFLDLVITRLQETLSLGYKCLEPLNADGELRAIDSGFEVGKMDLNASKLEIAGITYRFLVGNSGIHALYILYSEPVKAPAS